MMLRTDLDHLPPAKRAELSEVKRIIFAEFDNALAGRNAPHRKAGRILKIVLFGSHARGDWVADPIGGYFSDFDILVVVNHDELTDAAEYWAHAEDSLVRTLESNGLLRTPVNLIVHSFSDVNRQLSRGRPFFVDIVRDGIALYEAPGHSFKQPKPLSAEDAKNEAQKYFDEWYSRAASALKGARFFVDGDDYRDAAFLLHQATERLYHCILLVLTLYSPKSHKLAFLRSQAERLSPALIEAWPRDTRFAQRAFELLRRAYVDGRYSPHYRITTEELAWLIERVEILTQLVRATCEEHLPS